MCRQLRKRSDGGRGRQQLSIEEMMSTCSITPHQAENLIKKIDGFESRLMALESRSASTYFPEVIISSVNKIVENFLLHTVCTPLLEWPMLWRIRMNSLHNEGIDEWVN